MSGKSQQAKAAVGSGEKMGVDPRDSFNIRTCWPATQTEHFARTVDPPNVGSAESAGVFQIFNLQRRLIHADGIDDSKLREDGRDDVVGRFGHGTGGRNWESTNI